MKIRLKNILRPFRLALLKVGIFKKNDPFRFYPQYRKDKSQWLKQGGIITREFMILDDYSDSAGVAKGHYFHQDLRVANLIYKHNPKRHIDIASRIDGFVAHVAAFRKIEVVDVRSLAKSEHFNIKFLQADLMAPQNLGETDSISCLHAIEHFGLGRYTDPIDIDGHNKGLTNLINLLSIGGRLYVSFPIGKSDEVHFNAHRVFHVQSILVHPEISANMKLVCFDYVDDNGDLHINSNISKVDTNIIHGCGIYTFEKIKSIK